MTASARVLEPLDEATVELLSGRRTPPIAQRRGALVRRRLVAADVAGLVLAYSLATVVFAWHAGGDAGLGPFQELGLFLASLPVWILAARLYRLYDRDEVRTDHSTADELTRVFHLLTVCTFLFFALTELSRVVNPPFTKLLIFWVLAVALVTLLRSGARAYCRRQPSYRQNTLIVGAGQVGQAIARKLRVHGEYGISLVGFVDASPLERPADLGDLPVLGDLDALPELVEAFGVERVICAFSGDAHEDMLALIRGMNDLDVQVDVVPRFFDVLSPAIDIHDLEGIPVLALRPARLSPLARFVKRTIDLVGSAAGLLLLSPLLAGIAVAIRVDSPGPVFFRQVRVGAGGRSFRIWKFRTMAADADERKPEVAHLNKHLRDPRMFKVDDDPRVTRLGAWLRRHSLDELPQLLNVLRGEMSLVGPRPLILDEQRYVEDWATKRIELRPGMTGLWQVLGRDAIDFGDMVKLDYRYITSWSVAEDLRLLVRTLPIVLGQEKGQG